MSKYPNRKAITCFAGAAVLAFAASAAALQASEPVTPKLTPKLRTLLKEEMVAIQEAMQEIHLAMVTGEHGKVADRAEAIHHSFILKQSLTSEDKQALKAAVPKEFVKLDRYFHKRSAALAEAAADKDAVKQLAIYEQMTEACVACHSRYVTDRFPGLAGHAVPLSRTADAER